MLWYGENTGRDILKTALAIQKNNMAPTLGSAGEILFLTENGSLCREPCPERNIPLFLKRNHVYLLICDGIGCCMEELLLSMGIRVIPGIRGTLCDVLEKYRSGALKPGRNYSCSHHGRSCGECPGIF